MTPEGNWRAALVDKMHYCDVKAKELASDAKVPYSTPAIWLGKSDMSGNF